jgi:hypothetical protein
LGAFAGGAVAGNEFLVAESIAVGVMDFIEFMTDFFEEGLFDFAGDADADVVAVAGFDDFSTGIFVSEDYAVFPDKFTIS